MVRNERKGNKEDIALITLADEQKIKRSILKFGGNKMASLGVSAFSAHWAPLLAHLTLSAHLAIWAHLALWVHLAL
jgi:hypothetical protein